MNKKALIIVHANGRYDKNDECHHTEESARVTQNFYDTLINEIQSGNYEEIIYFMNLPKCTTKSEIDKALEVDPILSGLDETHKREINIVREGFQLANEFDNKLEGIRLENSLAEQNYDFTVAGLYYDICVKSHMEGLKARYPKARICSPEHLSRWSCEQVKTRLGVGQIGQRVQMRFGRDSYDASESLYRPLEIERGFERNRD